MTLFPTLAKRQPAAFFVLSVSVLAALGHGTGEGDAANVPSTSALSAEMPPQSSNVQVEREIELARSADWSQPALAWRESAEQSTPPAQLSSGWQYRTPLPGVELVVAGPPWRIEARRSGAPEPLWQYEVEEVDLNRPPPIAFRTEVSRKFFLIEPGVALRVFELLRGRLCTIVLTDRVRVRDERLNDRPFLSSDEGSLIYVLDGALRRLDLGSCMVRNLAARALPELEEGYNPPQCHCLVGSTSAEFAWIDSRYASDGLRPAFRVARLWHLGADGADLLLEQNPTPTDSCWCDELSARDLWGPLVGGRGK